VYVRTVKVATQRLNRCYEVVQSFFAIQHRICIVPPFNTWLHVVVRDTSVQRRARGVDSHISRYNFVEKKLSVSQQNHFTPSLSLSVNRQVWRDSWNRSQCFYKLRTTNSNKPENKKCVCQTFTNFIDVNQKKQLFKTEI